MRCSSAERNTPASHSARLSPPRKRSNRPDTAASVVVIEDGSVEANGAVLVQQTAPEFPDFRGGDYPECAERGGGGAIVIENSDAAWYTVDDSINDIAANVAAAFGVAHGAMRD